MWILILSIIALGTVTFLFTKITTTYKKENKQKVDSQEITCCGLHEICEEAVKENVKEIEYFDDEELDVYKGKSANSYDSQEIDFFREILYSLQKKEIHEWLYSLKMRKISFPESLKPEAGRLIEDES